MFIGFTVVLIIYVQNPSMKNLKNISGVVCLHFIIAFHFHSRDG